MHYGRDENENTLEWRNKTGRSTQRLLCLCSNGTRQRERFPELVDISIWERVCKKKKKNCWERLGLKKTTWRAIGQIFCVTQSKRIFFFYCQICSFSVVRGTKIDAGRWCHRPFVNRDVQLCLTKILPKPLGPSPISHFYLYPFLYLLALGAETLQNGTGHQEQVTS